MTVEMFGNVAQDALSKVESLSHINGRSPPQINALKRRWSSNPESPRKRLALAQELLQIDKAGPVRSIQIKEVESVQNPEIASRCPVCGLPCWGCYSAKKAIRKSSLDKQMEEYKGEESMEPPTAPASAASFALSQQSIDPSDASKISIKKRKTNEGVIYVGPKDNHFNDFILIPCGLALDISASPDLIPADLFSSESERVESLVFLQEPEMHLSTIMNDFFEYEMRGYDELTLMTICHSSLVLRDYFIPNRSSDESMEIASVRRDKWNPPHGGPPIPPGPYQYNWELELDTTYAVSINMFHTHHRRILRGRISWLAENASVAPYLTIEYKSTENTGKATDALSQVAAASMLWLHQRKLICDALQISLSNLRHYSIAIVDANYTFYEMRFTPHLFYEMRTLTAGRLTCLQDLKTYISWSNAIHAWGLGTNAKAFKNDIITLLELEGKPGLNLNPSGM